MIKNIFLFGILLIISSFSINQAQQVIPIIDLRENDANGVPVYLDETVTVSGIVTVANNFGSTGPGAVQDETAGISIFGSGYSSAVQIGDSVTVTAVVSQFNGLTELFFDNSSILEIHNSGNDIEPLVVTLNEIATQTWNGVEELESRIVRINNVTISGSGFFNGGTNGFNYDITDPTGSLEMRIDESVNIVGTPIPTDPVDIIAIVGQFDFASPYDEGYQIFPRDVFDLLTGNEPVILTPVVASNITPNSFTVYFYTARNGNTEVRYGLTEQLEFEPVIIEDDTTYHVAFIGDLDPLTTYFFKAFSTNENGTSSSALFTVSTSSPDPTLGTVNVYFNFSVDNSVAIPGNEALGNVDFTEKVLERINMATYSIDIALYSFFGMTEVADAIIAAKDRGVIVRVVYDNRNIQTSMQQLLNAGIQMSQRPDDDLMHNKFGIFDARDSIPANDWVWTGSWNWTSQELLWRNNVIEINDPALAEAYTIEFEEMWGSNGNDPMPANARFGPAKLDNTVHSFSIGGRPVELYFSPSDQTQAHIINAIESADTSIYFAQFVFTSTQTFNAINQRYLSGVNDLRGIIDDINAQNSQYQNLQSIAEMFDYNLANSLHHKYGLVDPSYFTSDPITITGSHNWSRSANEDNDENTLVINDIYIANQYMQEFKARYNELGGVTSFVVPIITSVKDEGLYPSTITLNQNYPNPFNPITTITFFLPAAEYVELVVHNILGEEVDKIFEGEASAGLNVFDYNARHLASGIYVYSLRTMTKSFNKKLLLLK